jgi:hypothetical protein
MPSDDLDHEVIESPEALFRHLYEAHGVLEAVDLDPATAPLQFWLRKHADLERAARRSAVTERPDDSQRAGSDVEPPATAPRLIAEMPGSARAPTGQPSARSGASTGPGPTSNRFSRFARFGRDSGPPVHADGDTAVHAHGPQGRADTGSASRPGTRTPDHAGGGPLGDADRGPPASPRGAAPTRAGREAGTASAAASAGGRSTTSGPRFRPFTDPVIEAVASALVGRGMDERSVRRGLSTYAGAGGRHGEEAVRDAFIAPMLDAIAAGLTGELVGRGHGPPRRPAPAPAPQPASWNTRLPEPAGSTPATPGRTARESVPGGAAARGKRPAWSGPAEPVSDGNTPREPSGWAAGSDADFMAIADVLQKRRRPRRPGVKDAPARSARSDTDDDVMALANAIQQPRDGGRRRDRSR